MSFTTWPALRAAIKDAIADHIAGTPCTGSYRIGSRSLEYRSFDELLRLYEKTYQLENLESAGTKGNVTSFGRFRNF